MGKEISRCSSLERCSKKGIIRKPR
ncbi:hypothetical protein Gogos_021721 [Gossypium gossypioides]|uniref:Uncharacterized protein n=1 Tax=Gossypium gossypioides TaxID=34282 RepID=A0A7J9D112_GOSGO|nr:hypothetical protein [Gossypium gossypioides]